jgi:hypothetical protein
VVEEVLGAELTTGVNTVRGGTVTLAEAGEGWPTDLRATSPELALRLFHALTTGPLARGHITGIRDGARASLLAFLRASGAEVSATLELPVAVARDLAEAFAETAIDWQARAVIVDFPEGRIHGFLTTPKVEERDRKRWHARIDKALRRARSIPLGRV